MTEKTPDPRRVRSAERSRTKVAASVEDKGKEAAEEDILYALYELYGFAATAGMRKHSIRAIKKISGKPHTAVRLREGAPLELKKTPSERARKAAATAVVLAPENEAERLVQEYVERMQKHKPSWKPEESTLGDGEHTFGDYWRAEPRDYEALARIVRRVLSIAR